MGTNIPVMKISQLLDLNTVVVGGAISGIPKGSTLLVLSVGAPVPGTDAPLVLPKTELEVTQSTAHYLVARPPLVEVSSNLFTAALELQRTKMVRPQLQIDEKELQGNPALSPVRIGDIVIRQGDLASYVDILAKGPSGQSDVIRNHLAGIWLHTWERPTNRGSEEARIQDDGRYIIDNSHCFDIKNATFDPTTSELSFDKIGVPTNPNPASRNLHQREDLKVVSPKELRGTVRGEPHLTLGYVRAS
jgi:hypothetical protein